LGDLSVDGRIILKWILKKPGMRVQTGFTWLRLGVVGFCEHNNRRSGSIKRGEYLDLVAVSFSGTEIT
jgi:hypothetical protein